MRRMSYAMTINQFLDGTKEASRRFGWLNLKPGEHYMGTDRVMGFKKGEHPRDLGECVCVSNVPEPVGDIIKYPVRNGRREVDLEGFPNMSELDFAKMLIRSHWKSIKYCINHFEELLEKPVSRIEFKHLSIL